MGVVPPLVGVAVNVTEVPVQIAPDGTAVIPTLATNAGLTVTARLLPALVPQPLPAVTVIFPFCPVVPAVTVKILVPEPAVIDQPVGIVQVYVVALTTATML